MASRDRPVHILKADLNRTRFGNPSQLTYSAFLSQLGLNQAQPDGMGYFGRLIGLHTAMPETKKHYKHLRVMLWAVGVDLPGMEKRLYTRTSHKEEEAIAQVVLGSLLVHRLRGEPFCQQGEDLLDRVSNTRPDLIGGSIEGLRGIPDRRFPTDRQLRELTEEFLL